jgi:hypothetical protein
VRWNHWPRYNVACSARKEPPCRRFEFIRPSIGAWGKSSRDVCPPFGSRNHAVVISNWPHCLVIQISVNNLEYDFEFNLVVGSNVFRWSSSLNAAFEKRQVDSHFACNLAISYSKSVLNKRIVLVPVICSPLFFG